MGLYNNRYFIENEVEPEAIYNDKNNPGDVELDDIADAALNANDEEQEYAQTGDLNPVDADPVDEAFVIMYESEYNFNQIMTTIGMSELNEAARGRDLILEAADFKAFFNKVKNFLKKMFEKISNTFTKVMKKLDFAAKADKKFVSKNKSAIEKGKTMINRNNFDMKGYLYEEIDDDFSFGDFKTTHGKIKSPEGVSTLARMILDEIKNDKLMNYEEVHEKLIDINIKNFPSAEEIAEFYEELYRGGKEEIALSTKIDEVVKRSIALLEKERDTYRIREAYNKVKNSYKNALASIDRMDKDINAFDYDEKSVNLCMSVTSSASSYIKYARNSVNVKFSVSMRIAKESRAQARRIVHRLADIAGYGKKNESASVSGSIFGDIGIM